MKRALLLMLALAGCGHIDSHEIVLRAPGPPTSAPELYFEGRPPARAFYDVAFLEELGYGSRADPESLSQAIASHAAQLGCDAVVRLQIVQSYSKGAAIGVCVRYSPTAPR